MPAETAILPKVIALCSRHGFIYNACGAGSMGTSKLYDLGPLGVELKQNICNEWWYSMVTSQGNIHGVESPSTELEILMRDSTNSREQNSQNVCEDTTQGTRSDAVLQPKEQGHLPTQSPVLRTSLYQGILLYYLRIKDLANKQLPFGIAQKGKCFRIGGSHDVEQFVYNAQEFTQLSVQYYCTPKAVTQVLDTWQRDRLEWWRKFAENPSNFIATDIQTKDEVQILDIQYKFPWGPDTIERIYNRGKQPVEELHWWMKNCGDIEGGWDKMGILQPEESNATSEQSEDQEVLLEKKADLEKRVMDLLKGRDGRRTVIPHTLEMTTGLERGMLAYILDGYSEKREEKSKKDVITEVMNLHAKLTPVKVAIVMKGSNKEQLRELSQYLQVEFRKSNINVIADNSSQASRVTRFDAMGVLFTIILHEKTIKEGIVAVRQRGVNILQSKHMTEVKEFVQRHLEYV